MPSTFCGIAVLCVIFRLAEGSHAFQLQTRLSREWNAKRNFVGLIFLADQHNQNNSNKQMRLESIGTDAEIRVTFR
jgi:hypothetical protein